LGIWKSILTFIQDMEKKSNIIKSKRLKFIRTLMYLDALLILLSLIKMDIRTFSWQHSSGLCLRIIILAVVFVILLLTEKNLSRYLRRHRGEE